MLAVWLRLRFGLAGKPSKLSSTLPLSRLLRQSSRRDGGVSSRQERQISPLRCASIEMEIDGAS